ncbi:PP2C family protein-serine/threonine phosphatase [Actinoplanes utahensis]|uniref:PPM-type phosphatase domain-containing protein n=1 Tax=Actinoplanes utahensis TaxID=1869 RepID=A0A0A6US87_ACTUT|nr:PP2C family protein-serine/threonine phosphatase [Actinoplanes utahensis]KHD77309.1 hypothetical protein MB27_11045 [Actinoplanes utahensis]GIF32971.1 hypothetical protein Aut01nite_59570 [Actinoplanes utahensis]
MSDSPWFDALRGILDRSHLWTPDDITPTVNAALAGLGIQVRIWLIDHEQVALRTLPDTGRILPVDSCPAFTLVSSRPEGDRLWVPMVDGTDRLGVIEFLPAPPEVERCEMIAGLVGHLIGTIAERGDLIESTRRTRPMSPAAELLFRLLPPLTSSTDRLVTSAVLQPCYEVGGDGFDYAHDDTTAALLILDAVGHGLPAGLACAVALSAVRATRRAGGGLAEQARAADAALLEQFPDSRFVTAVLAEVDLAGGRLRYLNAGHPAPLLLRDGTMMRELTGGRRMPLGIEDDTPIAEEALEPGDRLLFYTDGVTEARSADGDRFGLPRLVDLIEKHESAGLPTPETLRRLAHAVLEHQDGPPADDATLMLVQWSATAASNTVPTAGRTVREEQTT